MNMRFTLIFLPIVLAGFWALYNVFFLIKKSIPSAE